MSVSDDQNEKECPLCMELFDLDDINFYPCKCEYQICRFCWHRLRTDENGLCPACRQPYPEDPVNFKPLAPEEFQRIKSEKKQREQLKKQKITDGRKHLAKVRVLQKNLVFVIGLPPRFCEPELLKRSEYFGKFGKVHKVVVNNTNYAGPSGPSTGIFITYYRQEDALRAIQSVNSVQIDGRCIKASLGTTKYCSNFLRNQPCHKPDCMYLHDIGDEAASFTKEDMQQHKHTEYERRLHEQVLPQLQSSRRLRDSSVQRDIWPATPEIESQRSEPIAIVETTSSNTASQNHKHVSQQHGSTRNRQGGARNRNRQQRGAAAGGNGQKQRGEAKMRASPPAASMSPDRNGHALPSTMFSSSSTQGLSMSNGNGADSSAQSTSSSPSLFSSSLPNGGGPPLEIPHFGSQKVLDRDVVDAVETAGNVELDADNDEERSTTKSPSMNDDQKENMPQHQQQVCHSGSATDERSESADITIDAATDETASKLNALFSKLLCDETGTDVGQLLDSDFGSKSGHHGVDSQPTMTSSMDWQTALGLNKDPQEDDLGFDPFMESSKVLEELVREEKEQNKRQQQMLHQQQAESAAMNAASSVPPWDYRNRFRSPHQHLQQRPGHVVRPSAAHPHWHPPNSGMVNNRYGNHRMHGPYAPQSPPENHVPGRMEFVNSNYGAPPGFGGDMPPPPHKINGMGGYPQGPHNYGQMRQQSQSKDAFNLKEWQDGFRAILPNVNIKFAPHLSAPHQSSSGTPSHLDPPSYPPKTGWPVTSGHSPRPSPETGLFMFNRPPPPLVTNCSYPPPGMRRSPTADHATPPVPPPVRVNAPQQPLFTRAVSPFRHDFMNWPLDDLSPSSHPPPGFMASPSQQNVA